MLAQTADAPFSRRGWLFELKYDGVRALVDIHDGRARVTGRSGNDETTWYPEAQELAAALRGHDVLLDAEIVVLDDLGRPSFARLQPRIAAVRERDVARLARTEPVAIAAFDLLRFDGADISTLPLRERKRRLRSLLSGEPLHTVYVDDVDTDGEALFAALRERGIEGMVAKRAAAAYQPGVRSADWLKVKVWRSQTCVVAGYTRGTGSRTPLGALVIAVRDGRAWRHAGSVGSGFSDALVSDLRRRLAPLVRPTAAIVDPPRDPSITWVRPELYCEVRHGGFTEAGGMRHPTLLGMRDDVTPSDCVRADGSTPTPPSATTPTPSRGPGTPTPPYRAITHADGPDAAAAIAAMHGTAADIEIDSRRVHITNLDKEIWPGIPKRRLVAHYVLMAPYLLPHLHDRAVSAQCFPDGIDGKSFWRKRLPGHAPDWLTRWTYTSERHTVTYAVADSAAALAWLANSGAIDLHPWHSRTDAPEKPDWAVFDLDPSEGASFEDVRVIARLIKVALDHLGVRGHLKTSGQTGLQIYVPLRRGPDFRATRGWVEEVSRMVGRAVPQLVTWEWTVSRREGKVRLDYTQNILNKTLAAPYSLRPMPGAPVSTPLTWDELEDPALRPDGWTIDTIASRVAEVGELFAPVLRRDQDLPSPGRVTGGAD